MFLKNLHLQNANFLRQRYLQKFRSNPSAEEGYFPESKMAKRKEKSVAKRIGLAVLQRQAMSKASASTSKNACANFDTGA